MNCYPGQRGVEGEPADCLMEGKQDYIMIITIIITIILIILVIIIKNEVLILLYLAHLQVLISITFTDAWCQVYFSVQLVIDVHVFA